MSNKDSLITNPNNKIKYHTTHIIVHSKLSHENDDKIR